MKQMTEAELRKMLEDAYKDALAVCSKGYDKEMNPDWVNRMASNYADKVLGTI